MPEKTARWTTMLDGIPNDESGGPDYLRGQTRAHSTNSMRRGASAVAEMDRPRLRPRLRASTEESDSAAWVFGFGRLPCREPGKSQCSSSFLGGMHMRIHRAVAGAWILMACAEFAGCSSADGRLPPAVTAEVARDFNEGDALRTAANYTDDAQILAPQHPAVQGKAAIIAFFKANIDKYLGFGNDSTWSLVRGDMAIEQGVYSVRNVRIGENVEAGKYIRIWKRTNSGTWKLYRDMYSSDSESPAAVSVSPEEVPSQQLTAK
jgi:ketosteroid isomerase-like protein